LLDELFYLRQKGGRKTLPDRGNECGERLSSSIVMIMAAMFLFYQQRPIFLAFVDKEEKTLMSPLKEVATQEEGRVAT
jgi:hypothetical protein